MASGMPVQKDVNLLLRSEGSEREGRTSAFSQSSMLTLFGFVMFLMDESGASVSFSSLLECSGLQVLGKSDTLTPLAWWW